MTTSIQITDPRPYIKNSVTFRIPIEYEYIPGTDPADCILRPELFATSTRQTVDWDQLPSNYPYLETLKVSSVDPGADYNISQIDFLDLIPKRVEYFKFRLSSATYVKRNIILDPADTPFPVPDPAKVTPYFPFTTFTILLNNKYAFVLNPDTIVDNTDGSNVNVLSRRTKPSEWFYFTTGDYDFRSWKFEIAINSFKRPTDPTVIDYEYFVGSRIASIVFTLDFEYKASEPLSIYPELESKELTLANLYIMMDDYFNKKPQRLKTEKIDGVTEELTNEFKNEKKIQRGKYLPEPYAPEEITKFTKYILDNIIGK